MRIAPPGSGLAVKVSLGHDGDFLLALGGFEDGVAPVVVVEHEEGPRLSHLALPLISRLQRGRVAQELPVESEHLLLALWQDRGGRRDLVPRAVSAEQWEGEREVPQQHVSDRLAADSLLVGR